MRTKAKELFNKCDKHIINNRIYYLTALIMLGVYVICLMLTSSVPFGHMIPVSGDGMYQSYPHFEYKIYTVKSGMADSFYSFHIAGFKDIYRIYILEYILQPWTRLYGYIFNNNSAIYLMIVEYLFNYIFAPITLIYYLTNRKNNKYKKTDNRLLAISLAYGLSNFAISFYLYKGLTLLVYLPILMLGLEHLVLKKNNILYICILTIIMINDPYHAFILCEFIACYFLTFNYKSFKCFIKSSLVFAYSSIIAALLSAISILPFYLSVISDSPYQTEDNNLPSILRFYDSYIKIISDYHIANLNTCVSKNYSNASIYCGLITLFAVPMYLLCKNISLSQRIKRTVLLVLLFLSLNNELLNYIAHGFHYQSMVPNRQAIFIVFLLIIMFSDVVINIETINRKTIIYSVLLLSMILSVIYCKNLDLNNFRSILSLCIILIYVISIIKNGFIKKKESSKLIQLLSYTLIFEIIINSIFNFSYQISCDPNFVNLTQEINHIADNYPEIKEFYNSTEFLGDNEDNFNIGYSSKINSLSFFSSGITQDSISRIDFYNIKCFDNNLLYRGGNPLADLMLHIKYHIEDINDDSAYSIYPTIFQYNNYTIHENPYYVSLGFTINNKTVHDKIERDYTISGFDYQNRISNYLGGKEIYENIICDKLKTDGNEIELDPTKNYYFLGETYKKKNANTTVSEYKTVNIILNNNINGYIYIDIGTSIYCIGEANEANHEFSIDYPLEETEKKDFKPTIAVFKEKEFSDLSNNLKNNKIYNLQNNGRKITGEFNSDTNGMLYISLPYYKGWDIYIDGQKKEKYNYLGGLGVEITPGKHALTMKYTPPGMKSGLIITTTTLLIIIIVLILKKKRNKT